MIICKKDSNKLEPVNVRLLMMTDDGGTIETDGITMTIDAPCHLHGSLNEETACGRRSLQRVCKPLQLVARKPFDTGLGLAPRRRQDPFAVGMVGDLAKGLVQNGRCNPGQHRSQHE